VNIKKFDFSLSIFGIKSLILIVVNLNFKSANFSQQFSFHFSSSLIFLTSYVSLKYNMISPWLFFYLVVIVLSFWYFFFSKKPLICFFFYMTSSLHEFISLFNNCFSIFFAIFDGTVFFFSYSNQSFHLMILYDLFLVISSWLRVFHTLLKILIKI
jgi:hypothetical protein